MNRLIVFAILFSAGIGHPSFAEQSFSFPINFYPNQPDGCKIVSGEISRRFAEATLKNVLVVNCTRDMFGRGLKLEVRYVSDKPVKVLSNAAWPIYRSYEACLNRLAAEEAYFTQTTGLPVFLGYCGYHSYKTSWEKSFIPLFTPVFHAVGNPTSIIRSISLKMNQGGYTGGASTEREIVDKSRLAGIPIVSAYIDALPTAITYDSNLWLRFVVSPEKAKHNFADDYLLFDQLDLIASVPSEHESDPMRADSLKECEAQKKDAEKFVLSAPGVWFCMWDHLLFRSQLYVLRIKPGFVRYSRRVPGDDGEPLLNRYASHDECQADRRALLQHYANKFGDRIVGALCSWTSAVRPELPVQMSVFLREE